jgi:hypothetical protein
MNDLDMCKRMGEIEKLNGDFGTNKKGYKGRRYIDGSFSPYDPLTDDALCFQLMEKYGVTFNIYHDLDGIKYYYGDLWRDNKRITITDSKDLKRFVCLYIIELKKGK